MFLGSAVCYSNSAKTHILSVSDELLESFGAVSSECDRHGEGCLNQFGSELALSVTGVADQEAALKKTGGAVWFALQVFAANVHFCIISRDRLRYVEVR